MMGFVAFLCLWYQYDIFTSAGVCLLIIGITQAIETKAKGQ